MNKQNTILFYAMSTEVFFIINLLLFVFDAYSLAYLFFNASLLVICYLVRRIISLKTRNENLEDELERRRRDMASMGSSSLGLLRLVEKIKEHSRYSDYLRDSTIEWKDNGVDKFGIRHYTIIIGNNSSKSYYYISE